jgi:hypothetical protein
LRKVLPDVLRQTLLFSLADGLALRFERPSPHGKLVQHTNVRATLSHRPNAARFLL